MPPTPITIITGFLGSGKTTLILNLIPQLPSSYKLALLKNEFGDLAVDSQLAASSSISGVRELLNGCICCNLVGQLGDALETLRTEQEPDRIIIETSGSAFPATLAMEVNRLSQNTNGEHFVLDGVLSVIDVENWKGYDDTSVTAKMQAKYTDFVVFNKWELVDERRFDECLDRLGDLELQTPWVKSNKGIVNKDVVLGVDGALARDLRLTGAETEHNHDHQSEVEVLSVTLEAPSDHEIGVDLQQLERLLVRAPKEEVYRIKAVLYANASPKSSTGESTPSANLHSGRPGKFILNWAFGRWTFTCVDKLQEKPETSHGLSTPPPARDEREPALRMSLILARYEATKWKKRLEQDGMLRLESAADAGVGLRVEIIA